VTTNDAAIEAALEGFGATRLFSYQIAPQVATGKLKIVLEECEPPPRPIHIVHREGRYASAKVRAFVDLMAERLRSDRALNQERSATVASVGVRRVSSRRSGRLQKR